MKKLLTAKEIMSYIDKKTAMQELKNDILIEMQLGIIGEHFGNRVLHYIDSLYLEKEKDQLNVHFISGAIEAISSKTPVRNRIKDGYFENKAEQFYNYTYDQNK